MSRIIYFLLVTAFAACTCRAAKGKPQAPSVIGQIVQSSGATIDGVAALTSGTVLAGDTLATPAGGAALVKVPGGGQLELSENTTIGFSGSPGHVVAKIAQGRIVVQAPDPEFLVVEAARCRIHPATESSATSVLSAPLGGNATITARAGSISVTEIGTGQAHTLGEGETFVCPNAPGAAPGQGREESKPAPGEQAGQAAPPASPPPKHSNTGLLILLLGGGAAAGIGAAAAGGHGGSSGTPASPSSP